MQVEILEKTGLEQGERYRIEYVVEEPDTLFDRPVDKVSACLFVPKRGEDEKFPAIVTIPQEGPYTHIGKSEPAGLAGDENLFYGWNYMNVAMLLSVPIDTIIRKDAEFPIRIMQVLK